MASTTDPPVGIPTDPPAGGGGGGGGGGGLTNAELRATAVPVSGTVAVTGVATAAKQDTQTTALGTLLTDTELRATPLDVNVVSGGGGGGGGGLTDTELRAAPVPVDISAVDPATSSGQVTINDSLTSLGSQTADLVAASAAEVASLSAIDGNTAPLAQAIADVQGSVTDVQGAVELQTVSVDQLVSGQTTELATLTSIDASVTGVATAVNQETEIDSLASILTAVSALLTASQLNDPTGTQTIDEFTATESAASVVRFLGITCQNTHASNAGRVEVSTPAGRVDIINLAAGESVTHQFTPSIPVGGTLTVTVTGTGTVSGAYRYTL